MKAARRIALYGRLPYNPSIMATPSRTQPTRVERLEARLLPEQKRRIERAASHKGLSVSDFVVQAADEAAGRAIEQHEAWVLKEEDWKVFLDAIENPAEPNDALKAAAQAHKDFVRK